MAPILFEIAGFKLFTYTVFLALAFLVGLVIARQEAHHTKLAPEVLQKLFVPIFLCTLLGARFYFAIGAYLASGGVASFWSLLVHGGLAFYGGFIGVLTLLYCLAPFLNTGRALLFNTLAPALLAAQIVGRLGCFFNGCCHGKNCSLPWGVIPRLAPGTPGWGLPQHPSQIYEIIGLIPLFWLCRRANRLGATRWPPWKLYLLGYGTLRFFVEFSRGDDLRGFIGPLSLSQWVSLGMIATSLLLDLMIKGNHNEKPHEA